MVRIVRNAHARVMEAENPTMSPSVLLDERTTLWGEPEWVYVQSLEQLHVSSERNWTSGKQKVHTASQV